MRVLYWTQAFWPHVGGIEVSAVRLLPGLQPRGFQFEVVTSHGSLALPDEDRFDGIPLHRFDFYRALAERRPAQIIALTQRLARLKRDFKPDLIHINFSDPSIFFHLRTAAAHPAPLVLSFRLMVETTVDGLDHTLLGQALRSADWVTANSNATLADVRQRAPEIESRSSIIYERGAMPGLVPAPLPFAPPVLLCLGRLVEEKGIDLALTAFGALAGRFPAARLIVAGDGPARPALEQQAAALGVANRVKFTGWVSPDNVPALMNEATCVVVPSRWREAFGQVALEAAQMGRPVIAARVGGLPEVVLHGKTGLLFERNDNAGLGEAIAYLLERPAEAERMGRAARKWARATFDWPAYLDAHETIYRRLVKEIQSDATP